MIFIFGCSLATAQESTNHQQIIDDTYQELLDSKRSFRLLCVSDQEDLTTGLFIGLNRDGKIGVSFREYSMSKNKFASLPNLFKDYDPYKEIDIMHHGDPPKRTELLSYRINFVLSKEILADVLNRYFDLKSADRKLYLMFP
ncbi:hypothetical protein [Nonlabens xiamenensis]|uniref:hypothetical protein n=1 Tax=Nonlabens xiamenensis TaxID=2341043 RepID=UPI000F60EF6F|nr:hypothetical protein [Nonlabens xiamenensis]